LWLQPCARGVEETAVQVVGVGVVVERVVGDGIAAALHFRRSNATVPLWVTKWLEMYFRSSRRWEEVNGSWESKAPVPATSSVI